MDRETIVPWTVLPVDFETVLPVWQTKLWPGRVSPIRPVCPMMFLGGHDMNIITLYADQVKFFGVYNAAGDLAGVSSGHPTSETHYRNRGLHVDPSFDRQGIAHALLGAVVNAAVDAGRDVIWGLPRLPNVPFYIMHGWVEMSGPITEDVEFGPNIYMARPLAPF